MHEHHYGTREARPALRTARDPKGRLDSAGADVIAERIRPGPEADEREGEKEEDPGDRSDLVGVHGAHRPKLDDEDH